MISHKNAIRLIDSRDYRDNNGTFSIVFVSCNRDKKTGGEIVSVDKACKAGLPPRCKNANEMRCIIDTETGKKTAIHNRLIFQINGQEIYWV